MFRFLKTGAMLAAVLAVLVLSGGLSSTATATAPLNGFAGAGQTSNMSPLHKADTFRTCQEIYWCGVRRDGRARCGPTLRCRTCRFVRVCTRATGCVWREKCRWGPYVPPIQQ
ncbi:MAG: hypothetical protein AAGF14_02140 [Pseudomonadota bacterium]